MAPGELSVWASFHYHYHSVQRLSPGGGGGGGGTSIYVHIGAYYAPEHNDKRIRSGASLFYSFCRSGDHHFQNFLTFKPFHRQPWPVYSGKPRTQSVRAWSAPALQPARVPARCILQVSSRDPHFTLESAPEPRSPAFARSSLHWMMISIFPISNIHVLDMNLLVYLNRN